jgi:hypothetical protein
MNAIQPKTRCETRTAKQRKSIAIDIPGCFCLAIDRGYDSPAMATTIGNPLRSELETLTDGLKNMLSKPFTFV